MQDTALRSYTTAKLEKLKSDFEYTAQMAALERIEVDAASMQEYSDLSDELARREEVYRESCVLSRLAPSIADCLQVVGQRRMPELVASLADGLESTGAFGEVRLNPKNTFFREILLQLDQVQGDGETVKSAVFVTGQPIPLQWVKDACGDLSSGVATEAGQKRYDLLRLVEDRPGRLEFFADQDNEKAPEMVSKIVCWCW
ncbi:MAG TPA: hypothetical protein V6D08_07880 [Candidatus Obscuribacterales bacterium]